MKAERILVSIDGSAGALDALRRVLQRAPGRIEAIELVNVQQLLHRHIAQWIPRSVRDGWRAERSAAALAPAVRLASASGVPFRVHTLCGDRRRALADAARLWNCAEVVSAPVAPRLAWLALPAGLGVAAWLLLD